MSEAHMREVAMQPRVRSAEVIEVIRVVAVEGTGSGPDSVVREVVYLYLPGGELIARIDPCAGATT